VHHGHVLLLVAVVPERDDAEAAEAAGQVGDRLDPDADPLRAEPLAVVRLVALDQVLESRDPL